MSPRITLPELDAIAHTPGDFLEETLVSELGVRDALREAVERNRRWGQGTDSIDCEVNVIVTEKLPPFVRFEPGLIGYGGGKTFELAVPVEFHRTGKDRIVEGQIVATYEGVLGEVKASAGARRLMDAAVEVLRGGK